jgi:hypothetical protein
MTLVHKGSKCACFGKQFQVRRRELWWQLELQVHEGVGGKVGGKRDRTTFCRIWTIQRVILICLHW